MRGSDGGAGVGLGLRLYLGVTSGWLDAHGSHGLGLATRPIPLRDNPNSRKIGWRRDGRVHLSEHFSLEAVCESTYGTSFEAVPRSLVITHRPARVTLKVQWVIDDG